MRAPGPIAAVQLGCRVPENVSAPPGGHLAGPMETRPDRKTGRTRIVRQSGVGCAGGAAQRGRLHGRPLDGRTRGQEQGVHLGPPWPANRPDTADVDGPRHGRDPRAVHAESYRPGGRDRPRQVHSGRVAQQAGEPGLGHPRAAVGRRSSVEKGSDGVSASRPDWSVERTSWRRDWSATRTRAVRIVPVYWSAPRTRKDGFWSGARTRTGPPDGPRWSVRRTQSKQETGPTGGWRHARRPPVHRGAERGLRLSRVPQVGSAARPSPDGRARARKESDRQVSVHLAAVDVAQCVTCGGLLVPAGDDWRHEADAGCTAFGTPVICGLPAAVGCLVCQGHSGLSFGPLLYGHTAR
jgi:hypothetical protein